MATYFEGEAPTIVGGSGCGNGGFGYGGDAWVLIILFALIFGWGNNGIGGHGNGGGTVVYDTGASVQRGFDTQSIMNKLNGLENGLCDGFYAVNSTLLNGFGNVTTGLMQQGYETRGAITDLGYRMQDCCCTTQRAIDGVNFNLERAKCDIVDAIRQGDAAIINYMTSEKISSLQAENSLLRGQLSQNSQTNNITSTIISALAPKQPVPAYPVFAPNMSFAYPSGVTFGINGFGERSGCSASCGL